MTLNFDILVSLICNNINVWLCNCRSHFPGFGPGTARSVSAGNSGWNEHFPGTLRDKTRKSHGLVTDDKPGSWNLGRIVKWTRTSHGIVTVYSRTTPGQLPDNPRTTHITRTSHGVPQDEARNTPDETRKTPDEPRMSHGIPGWATEYPGWDPDKTRTRPGGDPEEPRTRPGGECVYKRPVSRQPIHLQKATEQTTTDRR